MAKALSETDVQTRLAALPGWVLEGGRLVRTFAFPSYADGVAFAVKVALIAEKADHHPDLLEITWKKVRVVYVTHSAGGLTELDFQAAEAVSRL